MSSPEENEHYHGYSVDTEDQPQGFGDSLSDDRGLAEPLDEGYSPPEKWSSGQGYGNTEYEEGRGESLETRLSQEEPDADVADPGAGDLVGGEIGHRRAGRLVEEDEGAHTDADAELYASDIGIDGAGASAEEAAVHLIENPADLPDGERAADDALLEDAWGSAVAEDDRRVPADD